MSETPDWGGLYRANVAAVAALVDGLDEEQLGLHVPATPGWEVKDLIAHLAGAAADTVTGRMDGAPTPEWSARHVSERILLPVGELLAELDSHQDAMVAAAAEQPRPVLIWDAAVHHTDLHEALADGVPAERYWRPVLDAVVEPTLGSTVDRVGAVAPYELFRGLFSRRSRAEMRAWGLGLDDARLDGLCVFGPREDDQPVPA